MGDPSPAAGRWLIDGNNVMGSRPDGWWRDRVGAKARLTAQVTAWSIACGQATVLVFDGRGDPRIEAAAGPELRLRFAPGGRPDAADDLLVDEAEPGDTVVTADRGLITRLAAGVEVVGPSRFLAELDGGSPDTARASATRRPPRGPRPVN